LLVPLADPEQILGLSPYGRDRLRSGIAREAERYPALSGTAEEVLALKPDLVLAGRFTKRATRELLRQHGVRLVELDAARSLDEAKAQLRQVGTLLGHPDRAEAAIARIEAAAARARAAAASGLTVLPLQRRGWVAGGGTLLGSLLNLAGLTPALNGRGLGRFATLEEIVALRPNLLVVSEAGERAEDQGAALLQHPALARLYPPDRRIVLPDSLNLFCGGPALAEALDRLAAEVARATAH
jgi:iron complex transport system substrate-binding protein